MVQKGENFDLRSVLFEAAGEEKIKDKSKFIATSGFILRAEIREAVSHCHKSYSHIAPLSRS